MSKKMVAVQPIGMSINQEIANTEIISSSKRHQSKSEGWMLDDGYMQREHQLSPLPLSPGYTHTHTHTLRGHHIPSFLLELTWVGPTALWLQRRPPSNAATGSWKIVSHAPPYEDGYHYEGTLMCLHPWPFIFHLFSNPFTHGARILQHGNVS